MIIVLDAKRNSTGISLTGEEAFAVLKLMEGTGFLAEEYPRYIQELLLEWSPNSEEDELAIESVFRGLIGFSKALSASIRRKFESEKEMNRMEMVIRNKPMFIRVLLMSLAISGILLDEKTETGWQLDKVKGTLREFICRDTVEESWMNTDEAFDTLLRFYSSIGRCLYKELGSLIQEYRPDVFQEGEQK